MNANRRKQIKKVIEAINEVNDRLTYVMDFISTIKAEEEECYDNLPESLQDGERGDAMQEAIDNLDNAYSEVENLYLDDLLCYLEDAMA